MTLQDAQHGDVFLVLTITPEEAHYGGIHTFDLPNGRSVMVTIPANTRANDEIRLPGQDLSTSDYQISRYLVLQISLSSPIENIAPADTSNPAEQTLLLATSQAGEFPLILPTTSTNLTQPAYQQDSFISETNTLYDAAPVHSSADFQSLPLTPINLVATPITPVPDEGAFSASLLSTDLAAAPGSDEATVSISELSADLVAASGSDETSVGISELPTGHVPAATLVQTEAPTILAASEIVTIDDAALVDVPASIVPSETPAANEIITIDNTALVASDVPGEAPAASTISEIIVLGNAAATMDQAASSIFTGPPPFLPAQPKRRKRPDRTAILSLCAAFLLLILSAGGLVFDLAYYQPYQIHSSATATTSAAPTVTAHAAQTQIAYSEQTSTAQQQATVTAYQNLYTQATSGRPFTSDSLKHQTNSAWDENQWSDNSSCAFKHASYEVAMPNSGYFLSCFAESSFFTDFAVQVNMRVTQGDAGGIFFRGDSYYMDGYLFEIYQDGSYSLYAYTGSNTNQTVMSGVATQYQFSQVNQLTIIAKGTTYYFYLNQHFLQSTTDKTFGEGMIGLVADDSRDATTVDYTNFKIWWLP